MSSPLQEPRLGRALLAVGSGLVLLPQDPWGGRAASKGRHPTQQHLAGGQDLGLFVL